MGHSVNYDAVAPMYDRRYENNVYPGTLAVLQEIARRRPGLRALEVGCGTGHWLSVLREGGAHVAGLDASAGMLERARESLSEAHLELGSAEWLPWADRCFDLVLAINAVHHFPDKPKFIAEAYRVLDRGGQLVVIGLELQAVRRWAIYDFFEGTRQRDQQRYPTSAELQAWMEQSGFAHCNVRSVEHMASRQLAREALERGLLDQHVTSQLSLLSRDAYQRGLQNIRDAIVAAEARGEQLWLETDLHLYGTFGMRTQA